MSVRSTRFISMFVAFVFATIALPAAAQMRITEYMYGGANGEFIEFTNVGTAAIDMSGWSFDDDSEAAGTVSLSAFGTVAAGESVILTETGAAAFRTAWSLCDAVKVIGGNATNLGRDDEINLFDAGGQLVDRLHYGDDVFAPGTIRANGISGKVDAAGLGANDIHHWTLSAAGDGEGSVTSSGGDIGSPGRSTRASVAFDACAPRVGQMRITEYMYGGGGGEFVEFTNVGAAPVDMSGWSFDDSTRAPGSQALGAFGAVAAGESVIFTETNADTFRSDWNLCSGIKIVGGNTNNLGRDDEINLYDGNGQLVDRLTYGDDVFAPGTVRANGFGAWVNAAGLGANAIADWTLSAVGDGEGSLASSHGDIASPGRSTRATVAFDPCVGAPGAPVVTIDAAATSSFLDLTPTTAGAASGVIGDPTDPAATTGIGFAFALPGGGDASTLTIAVASDNSAVVDASGLTLSGSGATRQLTIVPHGIGYATITISATDAHAGTGTYAISYAASAAAADPAVTRFHTGISDASATIALDADTMFVAEDETNALRLFDRTHSGLPLGVFDFSADLNLVDPDNPEIDLEASTRIGDRLYWTGSYSTSKNFHVRVNRHRVFATDLAGNGASATLSYAGRYDWLLEDLVAWDQSNGHGLGANYLGFAASSAEGVDSKTPAGFNIEGLSIAPDNATAYFAFRAPLLPTNDRHQAVIVPVTGFHDLLDSTDSRAQGSATFGAPIFLDLSGRGIRSLDRNARGQYLITAGPPGDATGIAPADFRLYAWTGQPGDAPFDLGVNLTALDVNAGSFESIAEVPDTLGAGSVLQFLFDNGDSIWYGDGIAGKDLADPRLRKSASIEVGVDVAFPAAALTATAGASQHVVVHGVFAQPLVAHVADAYGTPRAGVTVAFTVPASGASATLSSATATTDANGDAHVTATANALAGGYAVTARVGGVAAKANFALVNDAGPAAVIATRAGTPQSAIVHAAFAPLAVHVTDADGNAVANAAVAYTAPATGASAALAVAVTATDANGDAEVDATANAIAGAYAVTANVDGVANPAQFALTNLAGAAAAVVVTSGTAQSAPVGQPFAEPLVVRVSDADGNAIAGASVHFATPASGASATVAPVDTITDANGTAQANATANAIAGSYAVTATSGALAPVGFTLTNTDANDRIFRDGFETPAP